MQVKENMNVKKRGGMHQRTGQLPMIPGFVRKNLAFEICQNVWLCRLD